MSEISWYPFYVGDYARKTAHLSLLEHGAYRLLLDHYYATKQPLPNVPAKLYRICRARSPSERKAVLSVTAEFFTQNGTLMRSEKCDSVLNKQLNYSKSQSANAKRRLGHRSATDEPSKELTNCRSQRQDFDSESCRSNQDNQLNRMDSDPAAAVLHARVPEPQRNKVSKEEPPLSPEEKFFELFWKEFPPQRKGNKQKARSAWESAITRATKETIYESTKAYASSDEVARGFAKGAAAWLADDRWAVDYRAGGDPDRTRSLHDARSEPPNGRPNPAGPPQSKWLAEGERLAAKYRAEAQLERQGASEFNAG